MESLEHTIINSRYTNIIKTRYKNAEKFKLDEETKTNPIKLQQGFCCKLFTRVLEGNEERWKQLIGTHIQKLMYWLTKKKQNEILMKTTISHYRIFFKNFPCHLLIFAI